MFGDKITQSVAEAVKQILATEKLHPNQQKLDVHEPEKDKLTRKDFEMLRSNKKPKNEAFDPLKHVKNPSPAVKTAAKDVKRGSYADRAALLKAGGVKDDRGPRGVTQEEVSQDMKEGSFYGNDKMAKAAQDMGDSKSIVHMRDAKGTYTATMFRKQGEKNSKEISRVYDKKDVKEEVEEAVESPFTSYKKPREIESRGGSGIKQGTRYGGGKQKDVPTQDEAPKTKKPKGMMNFKEMFGE